MLQNVDVLLFKKHYGGKCQVSVSILAAQEREASVQVALETLVVVVGDCVCVCVWTGDMVWVLQVA